MISGHHHPFFDSKNWAIIWQESEVDFEPAPEIIPEFLGRVTRCVHTQGLNQDVYSYLNNFAARLNIELEIRNWVVEEFFIGLCEIADPFIEPSAQEQIRQCVSCLTDPDYDYRVVEPIDPRYEELQDAILQNSDKQINDVIIIHLTNRHL